MPFETAAISIQDLLQQAIALQQGGELDAAETLCQQALAVQPGHGVGLYLYGLLRYQRGDPEAAVRLLRQATHSIPDFAEAYNTLGAALQALGRLEEALASYRRAIALQPDLAPAYYNLGNALQALGRKEASLALYRQAIQQRPDYAEAYSNLGAALQALGRLEEALASYRQAVDLRPELAQAHTNMGITLQRLGQFSAGERHCRQGVALQPGSAEMQSNLGVTLFAQGQYDAALDQYRRALEIAPDYADAHFYRSLIWLLRGEYAAGWPEYEWRLRSAEQHRRHFDPPRWDGVANSTRTLLVHAEQGLGDTIQFVRLLPQARQRVERLVFECPQELCGLLRTVDGIDALVTQAADRRSPSVDFDAHIPLLSLPRLLGINAQNVPGVVPYLQADAARAAQWAARRAQIDGFTVGIVWAGSPTHKNNHNRSCMLRDFAPLAQVPGVCFVSLQKGLPARQAAAPPLSMRLLDWAPELRDFEETAALMANLDLIITVDTSVAHLAGALGKPVWTLLTYVPDWRWLLDRDDTPWYPSMRLFRQPKPGDWPSVIARVAAELQQKIAFCL